MQKLSPTCSSDSYIFNTVYCFQFALYHKYALVMLSTYAKLSIQSCTRYPRESAVANMHGTVFTLARLKNCSCSALIFDVIKFIMIGTIFNPAKVNTIPCMFTVSLSRTACRWLDNLAYMESMMHSQCFINGIEHTENKLLKV